MKFEVNPEYESLLPKITDDEYITLKKSIRENGQMFAIIVSDKNVILDGHNRAKACEELGIEVDFDVRHFDDEPTEREFVIIANLHRRHLTLEQRGFLGVQLMKIEEELARKRMGQKGVKEGEVAPIGDSFGKSVEKVAEIVKVSPRTLQRAKVVESEGTPELKQEVMEGKKSVAAACNEIKRTPKPKRSVACPASVEICPICGSGIRREKYKRLKEKFALKYPGLFVYSLEDKKNQYPNPFEDED
jgi:ParB-like chromosome segregation protein Spo0J